MPLSRHDAKQILRFCLGADDSGDAVRRDDGACAVTIALCRSSYEVHTFEGATFDEALRRAGAADVLKANCVDKQIAFVSRRERAPADAPPDGRDPVSQEAASQSGDDARFLALAEAVGALLHETQRERGISTLFVGSQGRLFGDELARQWRWTEQRRAALSVLVQEQPVPPAAVRRRLERAEALLVSVGSLRAGVEDRVVSVPHLIEVYSAANAELLGAVDAFMVADVVGQSRSSALACVALLHAKEKTGIERAQMTTAFLQDRFSEGQRVSIAGLLASQSSYLHIFSAAAPRPAEQLLRRTLASPTAAEVQRMERVVFADEQHGFGIDPATWFATITRKIDMLGDVATTTISMLRHGH
jgi:hypothetical protein